MSRTVELGRAVLSSPNTKLELWLTTLITISPAQDAIDLQHLTDSELIDLLTSGNVWVGRANGMHLSFDINMRRQPLPSDQLRQLAGSIANAPAWDQLGLQASLPVDANSQHGKLHINIAQRSREVDIPAKKSGRAYTNVTPENCTPPEGVPTLLLHSVDFAIVIVESRSRTGATKLKRSRRDGGVSDSPEDDMLFDNVGVKDAESSFVDNSRNINAKDADFVTPDSADSVIMSTGNSAMVFQEGGTQSSLAVRGFLVRTPEASLRGRERDRSTTMPNRRREVDFSPGPVPAAKRLRSSTIASMTETQFSMSVIAEFRLIRIMVDAAIRISVSNSLRGSLESLKIKASTLSESLANVAPALWRPGGLSVLSARATLTPTLCLSLGRVGQRARSQVLRNKLRSLNDSVAHDIEIQPYSTAIDELAASPISSSVAARIWFHVQRSLIAKPFPGTLQSFCVPVVEHASHVDVDEILEAQLVDATAKSDLPILCHEKPQGYRITETGGSTEDADGSMFD